MATPQRNQFCTSADCPARGVKHLLGLYIHDNQPGPTDYQHPRFGLSNPPPSVWAARERIIQHRASLGDHIAVITFNHYHGVGLASQDRLNKSLLAKEEHQNAMEVDVDDSGWTAAESAEVEAQLEQAMMDLDIEEAEEQTRRMTILDREKEEEISSGRGGAGLSAVDLEGLAVEARTAERTKAREEEFRITRYIGECYSGIDDVE
ncbi:MAG: hypothetical protein Q9167_003628 [Letrouitia subvulpina]